MSLSIDNKTGWEVLSLLLMTPFTSIWRGFVLMKLWAWFAVPVFGLHPLRVIEAIGVSLLINFMTGGYKTDDKHSTGETIALSIAYPLTALFFGCIIHLFM